MAVHTVIEGSLAFDITCDRFLKWDDSTSFRDGIARLASSKAVDICASVPAEGPVFIEIKDFRGHRIENNDRVSSGALAKEVAEKVRDTLAGLAWAASRPFRSAGHDALTRDFLDGRDAARPRVILWLEEDHADAAIASGLQDAIRQELRPFYNAKVLVTSTRLERATRRPLSWMTVRRTPPP